MSDQRFQEASETVRFELARLLEDTGIGIGEICLDSSLVDDLGLDSLKFVDLTLALEDAFGLPEFPMQRWVDEQARKQRPAFTVSALARACLQYVEAHDAERSSP
jgi:acyl carrier protein